MELNHSPAPESPFGSPSLLRRNSLSLSEAAEGSAHPGRRQDLGRAEPGVSFKGASSGLLADARGSGLSELPAACVAVRRSVLEPGGRPRQATDYVLSPDLSRAFCRVPSPAPKEGSLLTLATPRRADATYGLVSQDVGRHTLPLGLAGTVETVTWSPDGSCLALSLRQPSRLQRLLGLGSSRGRILLVDAVTGQIRRLDTTTPGKVQLLWSPEGSLLSVLEGSPRGQEGWRRLRVWRASLRDAVPRQLLHARWSYRVEVSFSSDARFLMLHSYETGDPPALIVIDMQNLPPSSEPNAAPAAEAAEWSSTNSVLFARDGSFARLGEVGRWAPSPARQPPFLLSTSWNYVRGMQASQAGGRAAVLTQGATVGAGQDARLQALVSIVEEQPAGAESPLRLGHQVWLHSPYQAVGNHPTLISWAPRGAYEDLLAVALPNSGSLWLLNSVERETTLELAHELGCHRWVGWSLCGEYLLVTDRSDLTARPLGGALSPPLPVAQLRIYRTGWPYSIIMHEYRGLSPSLPGQTSPAYAEAGLRRVTWLLPESVETIDFVDVT